MLSIFGLDNLLQAAAGEPPPEVVDLMAAREHAREARDYGRADALREQIGEHGWEVRDGPAGPQLVPAPR